MFFSSVLLSFGLHSILLSFIAGQVESLLLLLMRSNILLLLLSILQAR